MSEKNEVRTSEQEVVLQPVVITTTTDDIESINVDSVLEEEMATNPQTVKIDTPEKSNVKDETASTVQTNSSPKISSPSLKDFLDEADKKLSENTPKPSAQEIEDSKNFIKRLKKFFDAGGSFDKDCDKISKQYNIPKKEIAKGYISKFFGTISDVLHVAIGGIEFVAANVVKILSQLLLAGINVICNVARALTRLFTLNKTVKA